MNEQSFVKPLIYCELNNQIKMSKQALQKFYGPKRLYFVCGKVQQDGHFANRIVHWFVQHELPVIPINPKGGEIDLSVDSFTVKFSKGQKMIIEKSIPEALQHYPRKDEIDGISVNFVTPPAVTLSIMSELKESSCPVLSVWFQPGSWNMECVEFAYKGLRLPEERVINDCILQNGHANYTKSML